MLEEGHGIVLVIEISGIRTQWLLPSFCWRQWREGGGGRARQLKRCRSLFFKRQACSRVLCNAIAPASDLYSQVLREMTTRRRPTVSPPVTPRLGRGSGRESGSDAGAAAGGYASDGDIGTTSGGVVVSSVALCIGAVVAVAITVAIIILIVTY